MQLYQLSITLLILFVEQVAENIFRIIAIWLWQFSFNFQFTITKPAFIKDKM